MVAVPLGMQAYRRAAAHQPEVRLINLYMEQDDSGASPDQVMRLQRPGMVRQATFDAPVRGIYQSDNPVSALPLVVAGPTAYLVNGSDRTEIGTVADDGDRVSIAANFERFVIVSAGKVYHYDGTTFAEIAMPDGRLVIDVDVLNGYFLLLLANATFYWLVPGQTSFATTEDDPDAPLQYATAEALPDGATAVRRLRDELFFFGSQSIEVWQVTGQAAAPFQRAPGRLIDRGSLSRNSVTELDNTLFWVGDDHIVYRMSDVPERVSDFGIEERLRRATDDPTTWAFTTFGHKFYVCDIPGEGTFAYDPATKTWCEFASDQLSTGWLARFGIDTGRSVLCAGSDGLFVLDPDTSADDGTIFTRLVTGDIAVPAVPVANTCLAVGVGTDIPVAFQVRWQDPRRAWSSSRTLMARGGSDVLNLWRLGLSTAPYRSFEVSCRADAVIRISGAVANEGWRV